MKSGVYTITNTVNGKMYVGLSSNIPKRLNEHRRDLELNRHKNPHLQTSFIEYGIDKFLFEPLEYHENIDLLPSIEHYWVNTLSTNSREFGYNIKPTSIDGHYVGRKLSDETKKKISIAMKNRPSGKDHCFYGRRGSVCSRTKKVIDTATGVIYPSVIEASEYLGCKYTTLRRKLFGGRRNNTTMVYLKYYQYGAL